MRHTSFSFALDVSAEHEEVLRRHVGASRFAYNQCLTLHQGALELRKNDASVKVPRSGFDFINAFNAWKVCVANVDGTVGLAWRNEVLAQVFEESAVDFAKGLKNFWEARKGKSNRKVGFPHRKKKGRCRDSFRIRNGKNSIRVGLNDIRLPKIGELSVRESTRKLRRLLRLNADGKARAKILFATISRSAGRWFLRVNVEAPDFAVHPEKTITNVVGIDRGLNAFAVAATSDGQEVWRSIAPKPLKQHTRRLRRLSRQLSRTQKGSKNRNKKRQRLARLHFRIGNIRRDFVDKLSTQVTKTHSHVALEDLHIAGMLRNHRLAKSIADSAWGAFEEKLTYKGKWYGCEVSTVDRYFASSKTCCKCHHVVLQMPLCERQFVCDNCNYIADRDTNAAGNCAGWVESNVAVKHTETKNACGGEGSDRAATRSETSPVESGIAALSFGLDCETSEKDGVGYHLIVNTL
jgi:putative transposase